MKMKRITALVGAFMLTVATVLSGSDNKVLADEVDLDGTYHARIGIQGTSADGVEWIQRIGYYTGDNMDDDPTVLMTTGDKGTYSFSEDEAEISGNGTYTVALTYEEEVPLEVIKQLMVVTDIPNSDAITYSDLRVEIDGNEAATFGDNVYVDEDAFADEKDCLLVWNDWRSDLVASSPFSVDNKPTALGTTYKITFKVSGFNYDQVAEVVTENPTSDSVDNTAETVGESKTATLENEKSEGPNFALLAGVCGAVVLVIIALIVIVIKKDKNK